MPEDNQASFHPSISHFSFIKLSYLTYSAFTAKMDWHFGKRAPSGGAFFCPQLYTWRN